MEEQNNNEVLNNELENVEVNEEAIKKAKKNKLIKIAVGGLVGIGGIFLAIALGHKKPKLEEVPYEPTSIEHDLPDYTPSVTPINPVEEIEDKNTHEETEDDKLLNTLGDFRLDIDLSKYESPYDAIDEIEATYGIKFTNVGEVAHYLRYCMDDNVELLTANGANWGVSDLACQTKYATYPITSFYPEDSNLTNDHRYVNAHIKYDDGRKAITDVEVTKMPDDFNEILIDAELVNNYQNSGIANDIVLRKAYKTLFGKLVQVYINDAQGKYTADDFSFNIPELEYQEEDYQYEDTYSTKDADSYSDFEIDLDARDVISPQLVKKAG